jgi:hypothetical protein
MAILAPQKKESTVDKVAKGIGLATGALGIVSGIQGIRKSSAETDKLDAETALKNDPMKRRLETALKQHEVASLQDKGAKEVEPGTPGATDYSAIGPDGNLRMIGLVPPKYESAGLKAPKNKDIDALPEEDREVTKGLAKSNANKIAIANQIESVLKGSEKLDPTQKLQQYRQLIKVLNSTQGQDAVGAEEAKRLASKLEIGMGGLVSGNLGQFGRDLEGFSEDAAITVDGLRSAAAANDKEIATRYASVGIRKPERAQAAAMYSPKKGKPSELVPGAVADKPKITPDDMAHFKLAKERLAKNPNDEVAKQALAIGASKGLK